MDIRIPRRRYFISKKFQLKFSFLLIGATFVLTVAVGLVIYHVASINIDVFVRKDLTASPEVVELLIRERAILIKSLIWTFLGAVIFFFFVGIFFSHRMAGPIFALTRKMRALSEGKLNSFLQLRKKDEFQELKDVYNNLVNSLREKNQRDLNELNTILSELDKKTANLERLPSVSTVAINELRAIRKKIQDIYELKNKELKS